MRCFALSAVIGVMMSSACARRDSLSSAACRGDLTRVREFVAQGADVNARALIGTPLVCAASSGSIDAVQLLLDKGAGVNGKGPLGMTALYLAESTDRHDISSLLIQHGADVNAKTFGGISPLWRAADSGDQGSAQFLIGHGADINTVNDSGITASMAAMRKNHSEIAKLIFAAGQDAENKEKERAMLNAAQIQSRLQRECPSMIFVSVDPSADGRTLPRSCLAICPKGSLPSAPNAFGAKQCLPTQTVPLLR